jgi:DNA polymerase (family 10)
MARKGGVPKERVLNALSLAQFTAHLEARKEKRKTNPSRRSRTHKRTGGAELVR